MRGATITEIRFWQPGHIAVGLALVLVVLLPQHLLAGQPLHHDEALYATWALEVVSGRDPWLVETPLDKPPLFIYAVAGAMSLLGVSATAARLPALAATMATVALTFHLGETLYNRQVGLTAAWLAVLSPFTIQFAPTAFTDPLLVALVLAGCLAAARDRPFWAGLWLGLAVATKQQGLFFVPLVMVLLVSVRSPWRMILSRQGRLFAGLMVVLLPLLTWDFSRSNKSIEFLDQSLSNYGGLSGDLTGFSQRWWGFIDLLQYATGSVVLNVIFGVGLPLLLLYGVGATRRRFTLTGLQRRTWADWSLGLFSLFFLLGHTLLSFQVWDRYLLGLIPLLALLLARVLWLPWTIWRENWPDLEAARQDLGRRLTGLAVALLLAFSLLGPARQAAQARYPLGSNSGALAGIEQIVAYLQGHVGANNTLYHRWLGTHWRFYLWGYPYDLQYWSSPAELAAKARPGHLIAFPYWQSETEARLALAEVGLGLRELSRAYHPAGYPSIILYTVEKVEMRPDD